MITFCVPPVRACEASNDRRASYILPHLSNLPGLLGSRLLVLGLSEAEPPVLVILQLVSVSYPNLDKRALEALGVPR